MRYISPPAQKVSDCLPICVASLDDADQRNRLSGFEKTLTAAEDDYTKKGAASLIFQIQPDTKIDEIEAKEDMKILYNRKFAKDESDGRPIYDAIKSRAPHGKCPFCGHGIVKTLDHYLPKSRFPVFAITPINLVPCCSDCNHGKQASTFKTAEDQTLHPYFDYFDDARWLFATVAELDPPSVSFFVGCPDGWSALRCARIAEHFRAYKLGSMYTLNAASRLAALAGSLEAAAARGPGNVKIRLEDDFGSESKVYRNSWEAALYEALANSVWFCDEGYKLIKVHDNLAALP